MFPHDVMKGNISESWLSNREAAPDSLGVVLHVGCIPECSGMLLGFPALPPSLWEWRAINCESVFGKRKKQKMAKTRRVSLCSQRATGRVDRDPSRLLCHAAGFSSLMPAVDEAIWAFIPSPDARRILRSLKPILGCWFESGAAVGVSCQRISMACGASIKSKETQPPPYTHTHTHTHTHIYIYICINLG